MSLRLGIQVGERLTLSETMELATFCDEAGFDSIWVAEGRLTRDAIVPASLVAARTQRIRIGTGVVNDKSRNAALMAVTFKTLDEVAPGRIILGIGPWWEPLASKVGTPMRRPLDALREYVAVLRSFFRNEEVHFDGEFVHMDGPRFDRMYAANEPVDIPIYFGVVGPKMLELAGEIADGNLGDFLLPTPYVAESFERIRAGIARRTDGVTEVDLPQMVATSVNDDDPQRAIDACKAFLTLYLAQQPHIGGHSGVDPELVGRIKAIATWPATNEDIERAMALVSNDLVRTVSACGTTSDVMEQLERYQDVGATTVVLSPLGDKVETVRRVAAANAG